MDVHTAATVSLSRAVVSFTDVILCMRRAPSHEVADAVRKLDRRVFSSAEDARAILACAPAAEERKMFEAFLHSGGKPEALSSAERFCLELMQVRNALTQLCSILVSDLWH